jgi:hypothetical protein
VLGTVVVVGASVVVVDVDVDGEDGDDGDVGGTTVSGVDVGAVVGAIEVDGVVESMVVVVVRGPEPVVGPGDGAVEAEASRSAKSLSRSSWARAYSMPVPHSW